MFFYTMGLSTLIVIMFMAFYIIYLNTKKKKTQKKSEYNVLNNENTVIDNLITQLIEKDEHKESVEKEQQSKENILSTFVELHRSGSFCSHLSEQEIIYFVRKKLNMEVNKHEQ